MKDHFVPYELALKLKELGFDERCFATYRQYATNIPEDSKYSDFNLDYHTKVQLDFNVAPKNSEYVNDWVSAPLWQQAFDWFREKYDTHGDINRCINNKGKNYYTVWVERDITVNTWVYKDIQNSIPKEFDTYEEAREACLEKLIKILKK